MKFFTKQWYRDCQKFSEKEVKHPFEEYRSYLETVAPLLPETMQELQLHDCKIKDYQHEKDLVLFLDSSEAFCDVKQIAFVNARIQNAELPLKGAIWLYEEVAVSNRSYQMQVLLSGTQGEIGELTVAFDGFFLQ